MKKRKTYIVTIIANKYKQEIEVSATSKDEAENMVDNVLLGCEYFVFNDKSEYKLKTRKMKWSDKIGKNWFKKIKR